MYLSWVVDFKVLVVENRNLSSFSNLKALSSRTEYTYSYFKWLLTLIGMRQGTFNPLSFLDQTFSAEFLPKISKLLGGEN